MKYETGVDIVWIPGFKQRLLEHEALLDHLFTESEIKDCTRAHSYLRYESLAARFAVKEAVLKTMKMGLDDLGGIDMKSIEVRKETNGAPYIYLTNEMDDAAYKMGICNWSVSISHSNEYAICNVIGNFKEENEDLHSPAKKG